MPVEHFGNGGTVITGDSIRDFQKVTQRSAMRIELRTGMTHSGGSVIARIRKHYGFKGSRQAVYDQFCDKFGLEK